MEKARAFFKKIRDVKGTFHPKMGKIKDRNCMDLTKAKDIKKRQQEYTELYKMFLMTWMPQWCGHLPGARQPGV